MYSPIFSLSPFANLLKRNRISESAPKRLNATLVDAHPFAANDTSVMHDATSIFEQFRTQFTGALRMLCEKRGSVNAVCRELGINRQQFAKYLSGTNLPSAYVIQRLILYFAVDPNVFFLRGRRRHRFGPSRPMPDEVGHFGLNEGFYLEYTATPGTDAVPVSLWRFEKTEFATYCHGEVPRPREGRKHIFESFSGNVASHGDRHQLQAFSNQKNDTIGIVLTTFENSVDDLLAVRVACMERSESLHCSPSFFRYIGTQIDIADTLTTDCGLIERSQLNERAAALIAMLSQRISSTDLGFRVSI